MVRFEIPTVEVKPTPFGKPSRAEFYPIQINPETSTGAHIFRANRAEEIYVEPTPLLNRSDVASATVRNSARHRNLKKVEMTLNQAGRAKVKSFVAAHSPRSMIALVLKNEAHFIYSAKVLGDRGPVTIADGLDVDRARRLKLALK